MTNTLITPDELSGFPGGPFDDQVVDAAVAELRARAGWHIAPAVTETLTLDSHGGNRVVLPSLHVTAVTEVRNALNSEPSSIEGFRWSRAGILSRSWWPHGFQALEVDLTHGYDECPPELLSVIAAFAQGSTFDSMVSQETRGPFSATATNLSTLGSWLDRSTGSTLARYTLPSRP